MKKILTNKKGFTLIELLAVIVILAVIVMIATPAVTNYLNTARTSAYVTNARSAIETVRDDVILNAKGSSVYSLSDINNLLSKKLVQSPFGMPYDESSCIRVTRELDNSNPNNVAGNYNYKYEMCLIDKGGNGFNITEENAINDSLVGVGTLTGQTCACSNVFSE